MASKIAPCKKTPAEKNMRCCRWQIGGMDNIQNIFEEAVDRFMENGLETELDDEPGYCQRLQHFHQ